MRILNSLFLLAVGVLILSSCATNENLLPEEQSLDLLKTFTVKRDATGAYSLDYNVSDNVKVDNVKDVVTNTNQFYLYSSENESSRKVNEDLAIENGQFSFGFVDTNSGKEPRITIIDDNIVLAKSAAEDEMLGEYSIKRNEDETYTLNFAVKNNIEVDFVYNEEINTYEVHLEKGKASESNFERTFTKSDGNDLKIDFVNHTNSFSGIASRSGKPRKPKVVIGNGGDIM